LDLADADVRDPAVIERGISAFAQKHDTALIVLPNPRQRQPHTDYFTRSKVRFARNRPVPLLCHRGGLMSYGTDPVNEYSRAASYVDRILRGAEPAELPVEAPTKLELVVNLRTAKSLALTIPQLIHASATEVIE
jgi:putative ABC transport system substrate-binding protein